MKLTSPAPWVTTSESPSPYPSRSATSAPSTASKTSSNTPPEANAREWVRAYR